MSRMWGVVLQVGRRAAVWVEALEGMGPKRAAVLTASWGGRGRLMPWLMVKRDRSLSSTSCRLLYVYRIDVMRLSRVSVHVHVVVEACLVAEPQT